MGSISLFKHHRTKKSIFTYTDCLRQILFDSLWIPNPHMTY